MPRIEPMLSPQEAAYVAEIQAGVQFRAQSNAMAVFNFFGKLANVVWLHSSNACNNVKVAERFAFEMGNLAKDTQELSYELSFLSDATISELRLPYSQRNLDIVNMAILQTKLVHKQKLLIDISKALKAQEPDDTIIDEDEIEEEETVIHNPEPTPVYTETVEDIVKTMATPGERHRNLTSNMPSLTTDKLVVQEFRTYLEVKVPGMPFFNHVTALANLVDHANAQKVKKLLEKLNLMHHVFLFETVTKHRDVIKEVLVDSYIHKVAEEGVPAERLQAIFKQYLVKNKRDEAINGGYVELLEDIERAERIAAQGVALIVVPQPEPA